MALVLTGMGSDGLHGAQAIVAAGGHVMVQDEATSVVWGMPGQVAHAGICSAILPLDEIAPRLTRLFAGERA
jgi:two-component system chemotaxis response regulator CheB